MSIAGFLKFLSARFCSPFVCFCRKTHWKHVDFLVQVAFFFLLSAVFSCFFAFAIVLAGLYHSRPAGLVQSLVCGKGLFLVSTFIESTACRGRRPTNLVASVHRSRSDLLTRLLHERRVARFLIAPDGFGKTSLAYDYADVVFSFEHVFWVNGRSPCFLRDLDAAAFIPGMLKVDASPALVVFEDVPHLDSERAEAFVELLGNLLERSCEVIVTCAPSCDVYGTLHQGRVVLRPRDFLLSEEEARSGLRGERVDDGYAVVAKPSERIACLCWKEGGSIDIAAGISREKIPSDMLLAMFALLTFGRGCMSDLSLVLDMGRRKMVELGKTLAESYPFLGIDLDSGTFDAAAFEIEAVKLAVESSLDSMVSSSVSGDKEAMVSRLADALVARGLHDRAVDFVLAFSTKVAAGVWLRARGWMLIERGSALSVRRVFDEVSRGSLRSRASCNAAAAWASHILNDPVSAVTLAKRSAFRVGASVPEKMLACVLLVRESVGVASDQARSALESMRGTRALSGDAAGSGVDGCGVYGQDVRCGRADCFADAEILADLALAFHKGYLHGANAWAEALSAFDSGCLTAPAKAVENALLLAASWLFEDLAREEHSGLAFSLAEKRLASALEFDIDPEAVAMSAASFTVGAVERSCEGEGQLGWCCFSAVTRLDKAGERLPVLASYTVSQRAVVRVAGFGSFIQSQRDEFRRICARRDRQMDEYYETHPNVFRNDSRTPRSSNERQRFLAPTMHVNLFGGFEVWLGDELLTAEELKRRKVKALLAILVMARGREVPRDKLAETLWPHSTLKAARKNLYSTWALLTRLLSKGGSCPYLVRGHHGCKVNSQLVTSDVLEFESICRSLSQGCSKELSWDQAYSRLEAAYADDFMSGEESVEYIAEVRDRYRTRLVEALLAASHHLLNAGETQGALWFAREALDRDRNREDVYLVLMEAQIVADQRNAAIETFFACKKMLSEQLGIDPSPKMVALYRKVIETEEAFV